MPSPIAAVPALSRAQATRLQSLLDNKTKPLGSLGRLESLALQLALIQGCESPQIRHPQLIVFAGDHGAARAGVSAYPQDVTWQMVANMLKGGAAINVFARQAGIALSVVDAGVAKDLSALPTQGPDGTRLIRAKIAAGSANFITAPALTDAEQDAALALGQRVVHAAHAEGCNTIAFGEMGIGNTAAASLLTAALCGCALDSVIGRGTGLDDAGLERKRALLAQAWQRAGAPHEALHALREFGGLEIAALCGAILAAAGLGMAILIDGFIVTSALLVAHAIAPNVLDYCIFAHRSSEPGHSTQLAHLRAQVLLDLELRLGEGTGAALALPLLRSACAMLGEMASFETAGVSGKG